MVRRRVALTATDWQLLAAAALAQVITAAALRAMPLIGLRTRAARFRRLARMLMRGSEERVVWAIEATGRRLGDASTCLVRAVVADLVLGSPERPLCLTIGVRRTASGALEAHAWVTKQDRVLVGATSDDYAALVGWNSFCV
jgi:Transglutaminase-like superfamily